MKSVDSDADLRLSWSLPSVGAWVEITVKMYGPTNGTVAPFGGSVG